MVLAIEPELIVFEIGENESAATLKNKGNELFKLKEYEMAIRYYQKALK